MSDIFAQFGILAQGPDLDSWTNLLVIIIMLFLWLVGGIIKAMSKKKPRQGAEQEGAAGQQRPARETWQKRLARKAEEIQRAIEQGELPRSTPPARPPQPTAGKVTVRQGPRGESVIVYERTEPQPAARPAQPAARPRPPRKPAAVSDRATIKEPAAVSLGPALAPEPEREKVETSRELADLGSEAVRDYSDPDAVRKAILHYEILGKPVGLRDPSERYTTF